jgi:hypothetical protein
MNETEQERILQQFAEGVTQLCCAVAEGCGASQQEVAITVAHVLQSFAYSRPSLDGQPHTVPLLFHATRANAEHQSKEGRGTRVRSRVRRKAHPRPAGFWRPVVRECAVTPLSLHSLKSKLQEHYPEDNVSSVTYNALKDGYLRRLSNGEVVAAQEA